MPVRSQVSVGDNAELVENSVRYNPETKGWRLTLRMKIKDASKSTEMRAALVQTSAACA
jgi:glucans biosynthesis protein